MRALSIRQPYAEEILLGRNKIEYRSFRTRITGERFYIYAAKNPGPLERFARLRCKALHFHLDVVTADADVVPDDVLVRRCAAHFAGGDLEPRAVPGALDLVVLDQALAERAALVRADVVNGVDLAIKVEQSDALAPDFSAGRRLPVQFCLACDLDEFRHRCLLRRRAGLTAYG